MIKMTYEGKHFKEAASQSRLYNGSYRNKRGATERFTLRIKNLQRFVAMAGVLILVSISAKTVVTMVSEEKNKLGHSNGSVAFDATSEEEVSRNKRQIQHIIDNKPHILKNVTTEKYEVEYGDSLGYLAEKTGNTISRICELNNISKNDVLYQGQRIKLEILTDKNEVEKELAGLESYFEDYLFNSPVIIEHFGQFFGVKEGVEAEPSSIKGIYMNKYNSFHAKIEEGITVEDKKEYVESLLILVGQVDDFIKLYGLENVTPYNMYKVYLENGTTRYGEVESHVHSIYG